MIFALLCGLLGLGGAVFLIKQVIALPTGNERMLQIAGAIQEGAKAYLNRQIVTIGAVQFVRLAPVTLGCAWQSWPMCARLKAPF